MVNLIVEDWLLGIADCLRYSKIITINVGFSYLVWKPENDIRYVYAAKALSFARAKLQSKSEFYDFASTFRPMNDSDLLQNTFLSQLKGNVFESSGFTPQTLVCAYCWITKWLYIKPHLYKQPVYHLSQQTSVYKATVSVN